MKFNNNEKLETLFIDIMNYSLFPVIHYFFNFLKILSRDIISKLLIFFKFSKWDFIIILKLFSFSNFVCVEKLYNCKSFSIEEKTSTFEKLIKI